MEYASRIIYDFNIQNAWNAIKKSLKAFIILHGNACAIT